MSTAQRQVRRELVRRAPSQRTGAVLHRGPPARLRPRDRLAELASRSRRTTCAGRSCSSTSGRTPASTGSARSAYMRAWAEKYRNRARRGRRPHARSSRSSATSTTSAGRWQDMDVRYPVALDSDYGVWRAFGNRYWPAVVHRRRAGPDPAPPVRRGRLRGVRARRPAVAARGRRREIPDDLVSVADEGFEAQADWANLKSPETYLGYEQGRNFASPDDAAIDEPRTYSVPESLRLNQWALPGTGRSRAGRACSTGPAGRSRFASTPGTSISSWRLARARYLRAVSGARRRSLRATRTASTSTSTAMERVVEQRLYQLVREPGAITDRTFEISFSPPASRPTSSRSAREKGSPSRWRFRPPPPLTFRPPALRPSAYSPWRRLRPTRAPCPVHAGT